MISHPDPDLRFLIDDKKICIVGPSPDLEGTRSGDLIDKNFDVVIRTNDNLVIPEEFEVDYGKNTTIAYWNNKFIRRYVSKELKTGKLTENLIEKNVRFVFVKGDKTASSLNMLARNNPKCKTRFVKTSYSFKHKPDFWIKNTDENGNVSIYEPTLLSFILSDLFIYNPGLVYVTGMNFYTSSKHWSDFYNKNVSQKEQTLARAKQHHILGDKAYLMHMCKFYSPRIKLDPVLRNLLTQH